MCCQDWGSLINRELLVAAGFLIEGGRLDEQALQTAGRFSKLLLGVALFGLISLHISDVHTKHRYTSPPK